MNLKELFDKYPSCIWSNKPNKLTLPTTRFKLADYKEFNEIFECLKASGIKLVDPTKSKSLPYNNSVKHKERFMINNSHAASVELVVMTYCGFRENKGCCRFIIGDSPRSETNTVSGAKALGTIFDTAEKFNVLDLFEQKMVDRETGSRIKAEIQKPLIKNLREDEVEYENCHHIDLNSSYASRIVEYEPRFKSMYEYLYSHRKDNDDYFKHVLTNSIGCMQSEFCVRSSGFGRQPYALAELSKVAINGTIKWIEKLVAKLIASGRKPILLNTDGIWYQGDIYHDADEGTELCQWKNDHKNCRLYVKSSGAYQYIEDEKCHTVLRGQCKLDFYKPDRNTWKWREIDSIDAMPYMWEFTFDDGLQRIEN